LISIVVYVVPFHQRGMNPAEDLTKLLFIPNSCLHNSHLPLNFYLYQNKMREQLNTFTCSALVQPFFFMVLEY